MDRAWMLGPSVAEGGQVWPEPFGQDWVAAGVHRRMAAGVRVEGIAPAEPVGPSGMVEVLLVVEEQAGPPEQSGVPLVVPAWKARSALLQMHAPASRHRKVGKVQVPVAMVAPLDVLGPLQASRWANQAPAPHPGQGTASRASAHPLWKRSGPGPVRGASGPQEPIPWLPLEKGDKLERVASAGAGVVGQVRQTGRVALPGLVASVRQAVRTALTAAPAGLRVILASCRISP